MLGIILALIIFGFIIFIHEFGHYIVGKFSGCSVSKFSIGWGPRLASFKRKETEYQVSWIPLIGGYVRMPGMEGESAELTFEEAKDIKKYNLKTFEEIRTWQKFMVFIGGVGTQLIIAALLLTVVIAVMGKPATKLYIVSVGENSPAQAAGLMPADIILSMGNKPISSVEGLLAYLEDKDKKTVSVYFKRESEYLSADVQPAYSKDHGKVVMGINIAPTLYFDKENTSWKDYAFGGVVFTGELTVKMAEGIWMLISGKMPVRDAAMGPVGIVAITKDIVQTGFLNVIMFFVLININLAYINLLPFPALDGGHVVFLASEKIFRIKISPRIKERIIIVGFSLLLLLILYITFNDVSRLYRSRQAQREILQQEESSIGKQ